MNKVVFYNTNSKRFPVLDYINSQEALRIAKIRNAIRLLVEFGEEDLLSDNKKLKGSRYKGLHQLTVESSRIIYFIISGNKYILLHSFTKKTNKTPIKELEIARKRMQEYLSD